MPTPGNEVCRGRAGSWTRAQLGDLGSVPGDDHGLSAGNPIQDLSPVVAQIANTDFVHP